MSQSLEKGIEALLFMATRRSVGVTELAQRLGVHKSTASRILSTLQQAGAVEKNAQSLKYRLGPSVLRLSEQYYRNLNIAAVARPVMEQLAQDIRESVHLGVCSNNHAVVVDQTLSNSRLVVNARVGNREPLHCSSVGKCLLAFAPERQREEMLAGVGFERYTEKTIGSPALLLDEIEKIRAQGYATDDGELSPDIKCVAVPVFDSHGSCVYALGCSGAASRMTKEKINRVVPLLLAAAEEININ